MDKIKVGIIGYGNLGKGVQGSISQQDDMELVAIFSRRAGQGLTDSSVKVEHIDQIPNYQDKIDVMILCGGSAKDLPEQTPLYTRFFNTVDSFDTHAKVNQHFAAVDKVAQEHGTISIISVGWDPGLFSVNRLIAEAVLPKGNTYTFWGKGVSQGHSDAIRRIQGVKNAVQYTIPVLTAIERVRNGENPDLATSEKHLRECYVVLEEGAKAEEIETTIKGMPDYFSDYDTVVHFITEEEMVKSHSKMPHGGFVIRSGETVAGNQEIYEFSLNLESNPEFTALVIVAYARAAYRLAKRGEQGARTIFDIAPKDVSTLTQEELLTDFL